MQGCGTAQPKVRASAACVRPLTGWAGLTPTEALRGVIILVVMETLLLTRPVAWLEEHVDYLSCAALLLREERLSLFQQTRLFFAFRARISD